MMSKTIVVVQFSLAIFLAAASVWVGQTWRSEGRIFFQEQEKKGGIEKARLEQEAEKKRVTIIETYESEGRAAKGQIDGEATALAGFLIAQGRGKRVEAGSASTLASADAIDDLDGIRGIADNFDGLSARSSDEKAAYSTIREYLLNAATAQEEIRKIGWAPHFVCDQAKPAAIAIARRLTQRSSYEKPFRGTAAQPAPATVVAGPAKQAMSLEQQLARQRAGLPDSEDEQMLRKREFDERVKEILSRPPKISN